MRKFTGKAVSLVLALALTVSSFSGTFAFAAKSSEKAGDVSFTEDDDVTLVKDSQSNEYKFDLLNYIGAMTLDSVDKEDKNVTVDAEDITIRHSSGKSLLAFSTKDDRPKIRVKKDETGTETIMVYGEATITRDDKEITLKGSKELTINVVSTEDRFVATAADVADANAENDGKGGDEVPDLEFAVNEKVNDPQEVAIYKAVAGDDLLAKYEATTLDDDDKTAIGIFASGSNSRFAITRKDADDNDSQVTAITNLGKGTGTLKLNIKEIKDNGKSGKTVDTTTATVLKQVLVNADVKVTKTSGKVLLTKEAVGENFKDSNFSGYDFKGVDTNEISFEDGVSVGDVEHFAKVSVSDKAKVGDLSDISTKISLEDASSVIGVIDDVKAAVNMTDGRVASIEAEGDITIEGGTVTGDVKGKDSTVIKIDATDDDLATVIGGTVKGKIVNVDASSDAQVKINTIKLKDDGELTLSGETVVIDTINADYEGSVKFEDFQGSIAKLLNPEEITADEDTVAVINGNVDAESIDIDEDGSVEFKGEVNVDRLSGDGKLIVGADKLMINEDASSNLILKLAGNNVNIGDVAYKADKDASADVDSFNGFGFDVEEKSSNKDTNEYLVKSVEFAGVALDKTAVEIAKDYSNTVTVSNYPASAALPAGAKIEWDYSDADKDVFEVTENGATVTIKVIGFDSKYATSNEFDLTATVVDADGDVLEDYDEATATIKAVAEPKFSSDLNGIVEVPQGSVKNFNFTSDILSTPSVGNSAVAVTGTVAAYANGKATYAVKAVGAVGTTTGVYANYGAFTKQVFTVKVTAPKVTVDTTVDFALAKGNRYVYKVTAPAAPSFTVGNGAVIKTQAGKVVGNDYYFSVYAVGTAGQSTGVYVNGVKVNTITVK